MPVNVGFELFVVLQKGLVSYVKRYEYKNAMTEDLWSVLSEVSGEPVKELMDSWTKQQGYPVVSVQLKSEALVIEQVTLHNAVFSASLQPGRFYVAFTCHCFTVVESKQFIMQ